MTDSTRTLRHRAIANDILGFDEHELGKVQQVTEAIKRVRAERDLVIPIESANAVEFEIVAIPNDVEPREASSLSLSQAPSSGVPSTSRPCATKPAPQGFLATPRTVTPRVVHIPPRLAKGTTPPPDALFDVSELEDSMFAPHPTDAAFQDAVRRARQSADRPSRGKR